MVTAWKSSGESPRPRDRERAVNAFTWDTNSTTVVFGLEMATWPNRSSCAGFCGSSKRATLS